MGLGSFLLPCGSQDPTQAVRLTSTFAAEPFAGPALKHFVLCLLCLFSFLLVYVCGETLNSFIFPIVYVVPVSLWSTWSTQTVPKFQHSNCVFSSVMPGTLLL